MKRAGDIELFEGKKNAVTVDVAVCDFPTCNLVLRVGDDSYTALLTNGVGELTLGVVPEAIDSVTYFLEDTVTGLALAYGNAILIQVDGAGCPAPVDVDGKITEHNVSLTAHDGAESKLALLKNNMALLPAELPDTQSVSTLTSAYNLLVNAVRNAVALFAVCASLYTGLSLAGAVRFGSLVAPDMVETNGIPPEAVSSYVRASGAAITNENGGLILVGQLEAHGTNVSARVEYLERTLPDKLDSVDSNTGNSLTWQYGTLYTDGGLFVGDILFGGSGVNNVLGTGLSINGGDGGVTINKLTAPVAADQPVRLSDLTAAIEAIPPEMPFVIGGWYWSGTLSLSQTMPYTQNTVTYYSLPVSKIPTSTGVTVNLTDGSLTIVTPGIYEVTHQVSGFFGALTHPKWFGVAKNGTFISYAPIALRQTSANLHCGGTTVEYYSLLTGDVITAHMHNGGITGSATTFYWAQASLQARLVKAN